MRIKILMIGLGVLWVLGACNKYSKKIDPRHEKIIGNWTWLNGPGPYLLEIKKAEINLYTLMFENHLKIESCNVVSEDNTETVLEFVNTLGAKRTFYINSSFDTLSTGGGTKFVRDE